MKRLLIPVLLVLTLPACAGEVASSPLQDYEEVHATTILDAPSVDAKNVAPDKRDLVKQGEYMVELLGCGTCHTNGALEGDPDTERFLAGSDIGIAYTSPLDNRYPGVVFAPNITSDIETGIGGWSDEQLSMAIRQGRGRHGERPGLVMPWPGYAKLSDEDTAAISEYLRSLDPVRHKVPKSVEPGQRTNASFVYFGFYRNK